jgi:hypothetical protein
MTRDGMIGKILNRDPGIYFHISFSMFWWLLLLATISMFALIYTIDVRVNGGPVEHPMFIDGKMIVFIGAEPKSVAEAREIMARFKHKIQDGERVAVPVNVKGEK